MKLKYTAFILLCTLKIMPQQGVLEVKNYEDAKKKYFAYPASKIKLMKDNWGMYFKENVLTELDTNKIIDHLFEIKMDAYGSIYPNEEILNAITQKDFQGDSSKYGDLASHSFIRMFTENDSRKEKVKNAIFKINNDSIKAIYDSLLKFKYNLADDTFFTYWDKYHTTKVINSLKNLINGSSINRVIFFIHGFNVPYSLAALQALNIYQIAKPELKNQKVLYVPVYWPSNNAKKCNLDQDKFSTENIKEFKSNGSLFLRYTNRCYYAAITLRQIINGLDPNIKIDIITHSLGATIGTSCLINTHSKLHHNRCSGLRKHSKDSAWIVNSTKKFKRKDNINSDLLKDFYANPLPKQKIAVFLSAAAIPGVNTFKDMNTGIMKNKKFYVTINPNDEMVTKDNIRQAVKDKTKITIDYIRASRLSSTTLGCNYECEACKTKALFEKHDDLKNRFVTKEVSQETDHDIFTYMQQPEYINFFKFFLNDQ
jgi:hypothetical protein